MNRVSHVVESPSLAVIAAGGLASGAARLFSVQMCRYKCYVVIERLEAQRRQCSTADNVLCCAALNRSLVIDKSEAATSWRVQWPGWIRQQTSYPDGLGAGVQC